MAKNKITDKSSPKTKAGKNYTIPNMMDEFATEPGPGIRKDQDISLGSEKTNTQQTKATVKKVDVDKGDPKRTI